MQVLHCTATKKLEKNRFAILTECSTRHRQGVEASSLCAMTMAPSGEHRPWADLLPELLECVMQRIDIFTTLRLSGVCSAWAGTVAENSQFLSEVPALLASHADGDEDGTFVLHDVSDDVALHAVSIPALNSRWWVGSKGNWLVTLDKYGSAELLNPLSGEQICMPAITTISGVRQQDCENFSVRIILCKAPAHDKDYLAVAMVSSKLAFAKTGDKHWTILRSPGPCIYYEDVIFQNGKIFAVTGWGDIHAWDLHGASPIQEQVVQHPRDMEIENNFECWWRLAELNNGHLLLVCTYGSKHWRANNKYRLKVSTCEVGGVKLLELNHDSSRWSQVTSLGDHSLFLGANYPFSCVIPQSKGLIKPNCIYFASNQSPGDRIAHRLLDDSDFAIFHLKDQYYQEISTASCSDYNFQTPIWFRLTHC